MPFSLAVRKQRAQVLDLLFLVILYSMTKKLLMPLFIVVMERIGIQMPMLRQVFFGFFYLCLLLLTIISTTYYKLVEIIKFLIVCIQYLITIFRAVITF